MSASGTRRELLLGAGAFAGLLALPAGASPNRLDVETENGTWRSFIDGMAILRPEGGREVAICAFAAGLSLNDLACVFLERKEDFPRLLFFTDAGESYSFSPNGRL